MRTKWMLTALMMMGLSMGFIACDDDNDDIGGGGPTNENEYKESQLGWDIITQLTSERTAPEGWEDMTFEPTIGKASEADPYTRIVSTNDLAAAAARFGGLVRFPDLISETTTSFTYNQQGMGKLIYQKGSEDGEYLAQVEVDLKQVPHLKKILYQTPEQMGNNGSFDGTAYYRFGDVVMDTSGYYWICVRPAFGPEGKEDSHWMCLSHNLPDGNIKEYKTSTGIQDYIPTGLGKSTEHMQNTAEMFYAMLHPSDWVNALSLSTKPKMFNDFSYSNIRFHNMYFWKLVCKAWENENLFNLVLGVDKETLDKDKEWHMLYSGYSWWFTTSWECTLYEATFKNGPEKKANMHDVTYSKPTKDMHNITLDAKDGRTHQHSLRVAEYSGLIAQEMHIFKWWEKDRMLSNLKKAAQMHDIGKIAIDDKVLCKPGKFTEEEFSEMKTHAEKGAIIIKNLLSNFQSELFVEIAKNMAGSHHERWDGSGYPYGLKGESIPLEARVMAIADVYDALVSKRCYKDAFSFEEAYNIIDSSMGKHFDPSLKKYFDMSREELEAYYKKECEAERAVGAV